MDIKTIQRASLLDLPVKYHGKEYRILSVVQMPGRLSTIPIQEDFFYSAEIKDKAANAVYRVRISELELFNQGENK